MSSNGRVVHRKQVEQRIGRWVKVLTIVGLVPATIVTYVVSPACIPITFEPQMAINVEANENRADYVSVSYGQEGPPRGNAIQGPRFEAELAPLLDNLEPVTSHRVQMLVSSLSLGASPPVTYSSGLEGLLSKSSYKWARIRGKPLDRKRRCEKLDSSTAE